MLAKKPAQFKQIVCQTPFPTITKKQDAANERRALARFSSESLPRRPSRSDNASIFNFFFIFSVFPFIQRCKVRSSKGVGKGLWPMSTCIVCSRVKETRQKTLAVAGPGAGIYGTVSTIRMPPVPGGGQDATTGCEAYFVILLLLSAGRDVGCTKAARNTSRSFPRALPWSLSPLPHGSIQYGAYILRAYIYSNGWRKILQKRKFPLVFS